jgi:hypothetical protein
MRHADGAEWRMLQVRELRQHERMQLILEQKERAQKKR